MPFLDTLKSLDAKATPGPWRCRPYSDGVDGWDGDDDEVDPLAQHVQILAKRDTDDDALDAQRADGMAEIVWLPVGSYGGAEVHNLRLCATLRNHAARIAAVVEAAQSLVFALPDAHMSIRVGGDKPEIEALRAALAALEAP